MRNVRHTCHRLTEEYTLTIKATLLASLVLVGFACGGDVPNERPVTADDSEPYVLARGEGEVLVDSKGRTTIIKVSPQTGSRLLAMGTQDMPPGSGILVHKHDRTEEILYVSDGTGTVILGDEQIQVEKDTTIWVPPGTWHGVENPHDHMHILWFVTPPGLDDVFRGMFWHPGEDEKQLTPEEIAEIGRLHDSVARP